MVRCRFWSQASTSSADVISEDCWTCNDLRLEYIVNILQGQDTCGVPSRRMTMKCHLTMGKNQQSQMHQIVWLCRNELYVLWYLRDSWLLLETGFMDFSLLHLMHSVLPHLAYIPYIWVNYNLWDQRLLKHRKYKQWFLLSVAINKGFLDGNTDFLALISCIKYAVWFWKTIILFKPQTTELE